jgi:UDP-glucuronate 4-epimerase
MRVLVTGGAGFIGNHAAEMLLTRGHDVVALDNLNPYYDPALKRARLARLADRKQFTFVEADIAEQGQLRERLAGLRFDVILHLAAQAGVRYALENPGSYTRSNLVGHHNMLELARYHAGLQHFVYASSSSVYGNDTVAPYSEDARADKPVSYYGATKRAGELLSHSYAELFGLKQTGLRFFTVYGPWGRPDMAAWLFAEAVLEGRPIKIFGRGKLRRDFTYIDDIGEAVVRIVEKPFAQAGQAAPHAIYNLGNSHPESVMDLVRAIEAATGRSAIMEEADGPPGDVRETYADISKAARDFGFHPRVPLKDGIKRFVEWYRGYRAL